MGRPTTYRKEYCDLVIELGKRGKSIAYMASQMDVSRETVYEWARVHPEFSDALTRAKAHAQSWWEDAGQNALMMPGFNSSVWAKSMAARFPEDWRDNTKTEIVGAGGGPILIGRVVREVVDSK
jgi:hypothetical protein